MRYFTILKGGHRTADNQGGGPGDVVQSVRDLAAEEPTIYLEVDASEAGSWQERQALAAKRAAQV